MSRRDRTRHYTKEGKSIKISDMDTSHLKNTIKLIHRTVDSKRGTVEHKVYGGSYGDPSDFDVDVVEFDEAEFLWRTNYSSYVRELMKRV